LTLSETATVTVEASGAENRFAALVDSDDSDDGESSEELEDLLSVLDLKSGAKKDDLEIPAFIRRQMN
jgi:hypothetical protein